MTPNPVFGVIFCWLGGLAAGSFYVPFRGVKRWSWETFWLVGGLFSWIVLPLGVGFVMTNDLHAASARPPVRLSSGACFWGVMWGFGGLTFGLTMRYLGMSLGMAIVMGLCAAFGTLVPPIFEGEFLSDVAHTTPARSLVGHRRLSGGHRFRGQGRHVEREGNVRRAEAGFHQGVRSQEGRPGGHLLRRDERLFLVRPHGGRPHPVRLL
jgi:hypothetical protein